MALSDDLPARPQNRLTILPLDSMGVAELRDYVSTLRTEIERAEAMIARKQQHHSAIQAVFGASKPC